MSLIQLLALVLAPVIAWNPQAASGLRSKQHSTTEFNTRNTVDTFNSTERLQELSDGEARIWYLGHCGWAVETRTRVLVFDYWETVHTTLEPGLENGRVDPTELSDRDVFVFVSHDHGDHYDPTILEWADVVPNITYIFGWDAGLGPELEYMTEVRATRNYSGMVVSTINHDFDGIPEVAYLVKVDGLTIFHSGDHGSTSEVPNPVFTDNIDHFGSMQDEIDIAFISTFGRRGGILVNNGDLYTIDKLRPRVVFPMHHGGGEGLNQRFAFEVADQAAPSRVIAALELGASFLYSGGQVQPSR